MSTDQELARELEDAKAWLCRKYGGYIEECDADVAADLAEYARDAITKTREAAKEIPRCKECACRLCEDCAQDGDKCECCDKRLNAAAIRGEQK